MRNELNHFVGVERRIAERLVPLLEEHDASLYRTRIKGRREARVGPTSIRRDGRRSWVFMLEAKNGEVELTLWVGSASGLIGQGRPLTAIDGDGPKKRGCGWLRLSSEDFPEGLSDWIRTAHIHARDARPRNR